MHQTDKPKPQEGGKATKFSVKKSSTVCARREIYPFRINWKNLENNENSDKLIFLLSHKV
jgi:hypothetical protein